MFLKLFENILKILKTKILKIFEIRIRAILFFNRIEHGVLQSRRVKFAERARE